VFFFLGVWGGVGGTFFLFFFLFGWGVFWGLFTGGRGGGLRVFPKIFFLFLDIFLGGGGWGGVGLGAFFSNGGVSVGLGGLHSFFLNFEKLNRFGWVGFVVGKFFQRSF